MTFGITEPAAVTATTAPLIIVVFIQRARPRAREPTLLIAWSGVAPVVIVIGIPGAPPLVLIAVPTAGRALTLIPAAACSFRMTSGIAVPAAVTATTTPIVIVVIIPRARARAGKPTLLVPRAGVASV